MLYSRLARAAEEGRRELRSDSYPEPVSSTPAPPVKIVEGPGYVVEVNEDGEVVDILSFASPSFIRSHQKPDLQPKPTDRP